VSVMASYGGNQDAFSNVDIVIYLLFSVKICLWITIYKFDTISLSLFLYFIGVFVRGTQQLLQAKLQLQFCFRLDPDFTNSHNMVNLNQSISISQSHEHPS